MDVEFWFDPGCPFCWMTSRWITGIAPRRDLTLRWRPISLLFKNDTQPDSPYYDRVRFTTDLLRVTESVRAAGATDRIGDLYTRFGRKIHHEQLTTFDVAPILTDLGIDPAHAEAMDNPSFDAPIRASMEDALSLVGDDVGTPILAINGRNGRVGLFGPVITEMPSGDDGLRLWDGFLAMVDTAGFYELKRTRTGTPDMSTIPD